MYEQGEGEPQQPPKQRRSKGKRRSKNRAPSNHSNAEPEQQQPQIVTRQRSVPSGVDPNLAELHSSIVNDDPHANDAQRLQDVCESGLDLDQKFPVELNQQHAGMTPLALASALNKADLCQVLLDHGADVNSTFATLNTTALMTSSFHGHVEVVKLLLQYGADVRMCDLQQSTALGYAFGGTRNLEVIQLLLNAGIDVNQKNMLGMNALLLVAGYGNDVLVRMVLQAGADPNATNDFGHTALHLAVVGKKDQIKKLKKLGSPEAAAADRSLNRRNLDLAMQEWARLHSDTIGGRPNEEALAKVGNFMMSIGQNLEEDDINDDEDQAMKHRVDAVWRHRQEKIKESKEKKRPAIMNLLACGGGKSKQVQKSAASPYVPGPEPDLSGRKDDEVSRLSDRCAKILRMILDAGCEIDRTEKTFGMTALDMAILNGDVESSAILVSRGGDADHLMKMFALNDLYTTLVAAQRRDLKELLLYDDDLDVNTPFSRFNITKNPQSDPNQETDEGLMPVAVGVGSNDVEIMKMLLKHGADINGIGPGGRTALCEAAAKGNVKMVQFLLANRAEKEQENPFYVGATPFTAAVITKEHKTAEFLLKKGSVVDKPMTDGRTALVRAMDNRDEQMIDMILTANPNINFVQRGGFDHQMAEKYQNPDRDVEGILSAISEHCNSYVIAEQEAEAQRQRRLPPGPGPQGGHPQGGPPQGGPGGPPQPQRPAPVYTTPQKRQPKPAQPQQPPQAATPQEEEMYEDPPPPRHISMGPPPDARRVVVLQEPPPGQAMVEPQRVETPVQPPQQEIVVMQEPPRQVQPPQPQPVIIQQQQAPSVVIQQQQVQPQVQEEEEEETETETETESEEEEEEPAVVQQQPIIQQQQTVVQTVVTQQAPGIPPRVAPQSLEPPEDAPPPVPMSGPPESESGSETGSSYSETDEEDEEDGAQPQHILQQQQVVTTQRMEPQSHTDVQSHTTTEVLPDGRVAERTVVTKKTVVQQQVVTSSRTNNIQVVNIAETEDMDDDDEEETSSEEETDEDDDNANSHQMAPRTTPAKQDINYNLSQSAHNQGSVETEI